jgi:mono/diheme cytochrome c family protein
MRRSSWLVIAALMACASSGGSRADNPRSLVTLDIQSFSGEQIYEHICQACHMPQGQGAEGAGHYPRLAGDPALASWQLVALTVIRGRNGMPGFAPPHGEDMEYMGPRLSDAQVADVVNYVRSHFGNHYRNRVTAAQIAALRQAPP